jgi:hypothetical protein
LSPLLLAPIAWDGSACCGSALFFIDIDRLTPLALSDKNLGEIAVFDDAFIGQNVYSGLTVEADHRQNLHELILAEGIALNNAPQEAVDRIEEHNRALTGSRNTIRRDGRHDDCDHQHLRGVSSRCRRSPGPNKARARLRKISFHAVASPQTCRRRPVR